MPERVGQDGVRPGVFLGRGLFFAPATAGPVAVLPDGRRAPDARREAQPAGAGPAGRRRRPDLSGLWRNVRGFGAGAPPPGGGPGVAGTAGAPNADGSIPPRANQFWDIGWGMKEPLPLQPWASELRKTRMADDSKDNPDAHCLPMGNLQLHTHPQPGRSSRRRA